MKKILVLAILASLISIGTLKAQSCFNVYAGNDTTVLCTQPCLNLKARIPNIKSSEDYQVISIPYNPYPFITAAPAYVHPCSIDQDDKYADVATLPFNFCFYGNVYTQYVLGTNGVITFDLSNALTGNNYEVTDPLPNLGTGTADYACPAPPYPTGELYPKLSILGAYQDLFPDVSDPLYKIEARVEGSAPCRRFVMSYSNIKLYNCQSPELRTTFEVVLHEGTGIIDIFIDHQPYCPDGNNVIIGIQKDGSPGSLFASPPGRNLFTDSIFHEGWRFVPNGPTSLLNRVELYKNGVLVAAGTTTDLGNGQLEATFPVCQAEDSMSYVVRAFYKQCDNTVIETEGSDTMIVYKKLAVTTTVTDATCNGNLGRISVVSPFNPPNIEYSIDGGANWQTLPVFNVPAGTYTVLARPVGTPCVGSTTATVSQPATAYTAFATTTAATCAGATGTITITSAGGTPPYEYSITSGASWQPTNVFSNLPGGSYNVWTRDSHQCNVFFSATVPLIDTMRLELGPDSTICAGNSVLLLPQTNPQTNIFKWTPAAGLDNDAIKNPTASPLNTTKYYLTAKWGQCQRIDSITINVLRKPVVFAGNDTTICYKTNAILNGVVTNLSGSVNYSWTPPDSLDTPNAPVSFVRMDTTRQFTLTVTDNYGCNFSVSDSVWIYMEPLVSAFAGNDTNAMANKPHQLYATGGGPGGSYTWSPAGPLDDPFIQNPKAILSNDTYFTVYITDAAGCTGEDGLFIKVYDGPEYYIPNVFTPNGDGLNDIFRPIPAGMTTPEYFRVFNRNGQLVFQTNKWMEGWDGKYKGKDATQGTYVWMIRGKDVNGRVVELQGTVILLR